MSSKRELKFFLIINFLYTLYVLTFQIFEMANADSVEMNYERSSLSFALNRKYSFLMGYDLFQSNFFDPEKNHFDCLFYRLTFQGMDFGTIF